MTITIPMNPQPPAETEVMGYITESTVDDSSAGSWMPLVYRDGDYVRVGEPIPGPVLIGNAVWLDGAKYRVKTVAAVKKEAFWYWEIRI